MSIKLRHSDIVLISISTLNATIMRMEIKTHMTMMIIVYKS